MNGFTQHHAITSALQYVERNVAAWVGQRGGLCADIPPSVSARGPLEHIIAPSVSACTYEPEIFCAEAQLNILRQTQPVKVMDRLGDLAEELLAKMKPRFSWPAIGTPLWLLWVWPLEANRDLYNDKLRMRCAVVIAPADVISAFINGEKKT